jgi:hypothetical protein
MHDTLLVRGDFTMKTLNPYFAFVQDVDDVSIPHSGQPMCYDNHCAVTLLNHYLIQSSLHLRLALSI